MNPTASSSGPLNSTTAPPGPPIGKQEPAEPPAWLGARAAPLVAAVVVVALLALFAWAIARPSDSVGLAPVHARDVPDLSLQMMDGSAVRISDLRGRPAVINFWASWCVPCEVEAPVLEEAARAYSDRVAFVGINVQDTDADARRFLERFGVSYPNARDASGEVAIAFGMTGVPETYVLDAQGSIVHKWNGAVTRESIERMVSDTLDAGL